MRRLLELFGVLTISLGLTTSVVSCDDKDDELEKIKKDIKDKDSTIAFLTDQKNQLQQRLDSLCQEQEELNLEIQHDKEELKKMDEENSKFQVDLEEHNELIRKKEKRIEAITKERNDILEEKETIEKEYNIFLINVVHYLFFNREINENKKILDVFRILWKENKKDEALSFFQDSFTEVKDIYALLISKDICNIQMKIINTIETENEIKIIFSFLVDSYSSNEEILRIFKSNIS